ncbi:CotH kinase family protein [Lactiplantibacillus plantarum]|uniref:CotH kinase family protein n=1 Tax=Lactiplantibacillus plantarum TaxID=1590 RepID=UPI003B50968F
MYQKTPWTPHEIISTTRMNNIEQGIYQSSIGGNSIPVVNLTGDTSDLETGKKSTLSFDFNDGNQEIEGYVKIKWQGNSSQNYPKKNYKITIYSDSGLKNAYNIQPKKSWLPCNTFNLKANWIDCLQARNLMNAELVRQMTLDRIYYYYHVDTSAPSRPSTIDLSTYYQSQAFGEMQGFFVEVYINGVDKGLYTFNTNKNAVSFNMDPSNANHIAIEDNNGGHVPAGLLNVDSDDLYGTNFDPITPSEVTPAMQTAFNAFLKFVNSSTDADFLANAYNTIDINAAIDNYLISEALDIEDTQDKSLLYLTYDAKYWIPTLYDLDSGNGLHWDGTLHADYQNYHADGGINHLYARILTSFHDRVVARYQYLRKTILTPDHIVELFKNHVNSISSYYFDNEKKIWPNLPSSDTNTIEYMQWYIPVVLVEMGQLKYIKSLAGLHF